MAQKVRMPDGVLVSFPDDMPREEIRALIEAKFPKEAASRQPKQSASDPLMLPSQAMSGVNEGIANIMSLPTTVANAALSVGPAIFNAVTGENRPVPLVEQATKGKSWIPDPGADARDVMTETGMIREKTDDVGGQVVRRIGEEIGAAVPFLGTAGKVGASLKALGSVAGSGAGAAAAEQIAPDNPLAETAGQLLGGLTPGAIGASLRKSVAAKAAPSVEELTTEARGLYESARKSGVVAPQPATKQLAADMRQIAVDNEIILPSGAINSTYPKINSALSAFDEYAAGTMSVGRMQAVRRNLQDAVNSLDKGEQRIGLLMLKKFDDFTSNLAPQLREANAIYHRAMKGELIDQAIELAGSRAGQFSGSGFENALRVEFRRLERDLIKEKLVGFSDEEIAAISKVARGDNITNVLRGLGRMAPTGALSFGVGGPGMFAVGNALGGPMGGAALSGATMGTGLLARGAATARTSGAANNAGALVRRGEGAGPFLKPSDAPALQAVGAGVAAANDNPPTKRSTVTLREMMARGGQLR